MVANRIMAWLRILAKAMIYFASAESSLAVRRIAMTSSPGAQRLQAADASNRNEGIRRGTLNMPTMLAAQHASVNGCFESANRGEEELEDSRPVQRLPLQEIGSSPRTMDA